MLVYSTPPKEWTILPSRVGKIQVGHIVPLSVFTQRPTFYQGMYADNLPEIVLHLQKADIKIGLEYLIFVRAIYPGKDIKTEQNTGTGSTLKELKSAHGTLDLYHIPEPYMCSVTTPTLPNVYFQFTSCDDAKMNGKVARVILW